MSIFENKNNYMVFIRLLQQTLLKHGFILQKTHQAIQYKQSCWFKLYIDLNTKLGTDSKNDFEKKIFKINE